MTAMTDAMSAMKAATMKAATMKAATMKHYLITMYQPDGVMPPPEFLDKVMTELGAVRRDL